MVYASFQHLYVTADICVSAITMTTAMWPYMTTCLARITPRLLFFPSTTMVSLSCSFGTTAGETPSQSASSPLYFYQYTTLQAALLQCSASSHSPQLCRYPPSPDLR